MTEFTSPRSDAPSEELPPDELTPETVALRARETRRKIEKARARIAALEKNTETLSIELAELQRQRDGLALIARLPEKQDAALLKIAELSTYIHTVTSELITANQQLMSEIESLETLAGELEEIGALAVKVAALSKRRGQA